MKNKKQKTKKQNKKTKQNKTKQNKQKKNLSGIPLPSPSPSDLNYINESFEWGGIQKAKGLKQGKDRSQTLVRGLMKNKNKNKTKQKKTKNKNKTKQTKEKPLGNSFALPLPFRPQLHKRELRMRRYSES